MQFCRKAWYTLDMADGWNLDGRRGRASIPPPHALIPMAGNSFIPRLNCTKLGMIAEPLTLPIVEPLRLGVVDSPWNATQA